MFRHVVLWTLPEENRPGVNRENAIKIKAGLEELRYLVDGIVKMEVIIDPVSIGTCDADIMLDSEFVSREAFEEYLDHPRHLAVKSLIAASVGKRLCMDYEFNAGLRMLDSE